MSRLDPACRPVLQPWVRLRHDKVRDAWVLLAPERVLFPCPTSCEILARCDGERTLASIVDELAGEFEAPRAAIAADVDAMLGDLAEKGFLRAETAR
jgi:pyrroloquinoline quinone biosynthesis protein D